jgi:hypothetical protein
MGHTNDISAITQEYIKNNTLNITSLSFLSTSSSSRNDIKRKKQTDKNIIVDLLYIHDKIKKYFESEKINIKEYKKKIREILYFININLPSNMSNDDILFLKNIRNKYHMDEIDEPQKINDNLNLEQYKQYISDIISLETHIENLNIYESYFNIFSESHIEKYKNILTQPAKSSFIKSKNKKNKIKINEKSNIMKSYFININNYFKEEFIIRIIGKQHYNEIQKFLIENNTNKIDNII